MKRTEPSPEDVALILLCKRERAKLKKQLKELSNQALAIKFGLSYDTVNRLVGDAETDAEDA